MLGLGIAAGLGPAAGIYGAIRRVLYRSVRRTKSLISGPTGSMKVAMAVIVARRPQHLWAFTIVTWPDYSVIRPVRIGRSSIPRIRHIRVMSGVGVIIIVGFEPFIGGHVGRWGRVPHDCSIPILWVRQRPS